MMPYMKLGLRPRDGYNYSNPAIVYVARIIEQITGDPWQGYIPRTWSIPWRCRELVWVTTHGISSSVGSPQLSRRAGRQRRGRVRDGGIDFDQEPRLPNGGWNGTDQRYCDLASFLTEF